eukprot:gene6233-12624_t
MIDIDDLLSRLVKAISEVDGLCAPSKTIFQELIEQLKLFFDYASSSSRKQFGPFKELITENLDIESIWELLQTRNRPLIRYLKKSTTKLSNNHLLKSSTQIVHGTKNDNIGQSTGSYKKFSNKSKIVETSEEDEEMHRKRDERRLLNKGHKGVEEDDDTEEEDDFDFVARELYNIEDNEDNDNGDGDNKSANTIKYADFFGKRSKTAAKSKGTGKNDEEEDNEDDEDDNEADGNDTNNNNKMMKKQSYDGSESEQPEVTKLSKRKLKIAEEIARLEEAAIAPKSWELRGEVRSADRPLNSLLELSTQVERASKPRPLITQEHSNSLEDLIRKRIKDDKFDDVVPLRPTQLLEKPDHDGLPELSQEKSKKGLGEIYADEFRKQAMGINETTHAAAADATEIEIRELFDKVCRHLDALSHFSFCPKPVVREASLTVSQIQALPALSLEDVNPTLESSADARAPEEVQDRKRGRAGALVSEVELGRDDKKRLRQASKNANKAKKTRERNDNQRKNDEEENEQDDVNNIQRRKRSKEDDKEFSNDSRVKVISSDDYIQQSSNTFKSSEFFNRLQQEAVSKISNVNSKKGIKNNNGNDLKASQIKL